MIDLVLFKKGIHKLLMFTGYTSVYRGTILLDNTYDSWEPVLIERILFVYALFISLLGERGLKT